MLDNLKPTELAQLYHLAVLYPKLVSETAKDIRETLRWAVGNDEAFELIQAAENSHS
jgi:hypothetical protein